MSMRRTPYVNPATLATATTNISTNTTNIATNTADIALGYPCHEVSKPSGAIAQTLDCGNASLVNLAAALTTQVVTVQAIYLKAGETILVAAHGNSLRAIVKLLFGVGEAEIVHVEIPTGNPLLIELDGGLRPLSARYLDETRAQPLPALP